MAIPLRATLLALLSSSAAASENATECEAGVSVNLLTCSDDDAFDNTKHLGFFCHAELTSVDFKSDADCRKVFGIPDAYKFEAATPTAPLQGRCVVHLIEAGLVRGNTGPRRKGKAPNPLKKCKQGVAAQRRDCDVLGVMGLSQLSLSAGVQANWYCAIVDNQTILEQCPRGWELDGQDQGVGNEYPWRNCFKRSNFVVGTGEPYDPLHPPNGTSPGGGHPPGGVSMGSFIFVLLFGICGWGALIGREIRRRMKQGAEGRAPLESTLAYTHQVDDHAEKLARVRAEILQERQQNDYTAPDTPLPPLQPAPVAPL